MLKTREMAYLAACRDELRNWTQGDDIYGDVDISDGAYQDDPEILVTYLAGESLELIERGCRPNVVGPRTKLAKMSIRAALRRDLVPPIDDFYPGDVPAGEGPYDTWMDGIGCFESETRFAHSLSSQHKRVRENHPACILLDIDGRPIAYQKGNGKPTAMVYQDGYISTTDGPRWAPKEALIRPIYEEGYDPRVVYANESLLLLQNPHIRLAHFLRFNIASWLPKSISRKTLRQASERIGADVSESDIKLGASLSAKQLQRRVDSLLARGPAPWIVDTTWL